MRFGSAASRTRTLQVKACQLGADEGLGLAIVYVDDVNAASLPGVGEGPGSSTLLDQTPAIDPIDILCRGL